jgi:hypothetical protein
LQADVRPHRVEGIAGDEGELRRVGRVEHARVGLVDDGDVAHAVARQRAARPFDVDLIVHAERPQECEMRVAVRDDHRIARRARRRGAADVGRAEGERSRAGVVEHVEHHAAAGHREPRDRPHVGPRPRPPRGSSIARADPR